MHILGRASFVVAVVSVLLANTAFAQTDLEAEVAALREGQTKMQADLAEIKRLLAAGARANPGTPAFKPADLEVRNSTVLGSADAQVTLIGYSDYQCPFCSRHAKNVFPELVKEYVDSGKLKIIMRENPIASIHPLANDASQAALCAGEQGKYWEMHDLMFVDQKKITPTDLKAHAVTLGLTPSRFNACLDTKKYSNQIQSDLAEASKLGISGTPSFVIGLTDKEDSNKVRVTEYLRGAKDMNSFRTVIDGLLASAE
jgi:protein-disulfide isomerase